MDRAADELAAFPDPAGAASTRTGRASRTRKIARIILYARHFEAEYLPFLTEKQLKLDFKFSMDRDGFYRRFQGLDRKVKDFLEEHKRLEDGVFSKDMETEVRKRSFKLKRHHRRRGRAGSSGPSRASRGSWWRMPAATG